MSLVQENFIRMANAVTDVLGRYPEWKSVSAFEAEQQNFEAYMSMLQEKRIHAQMKSKGATEDKDALKEQAISLTVNLAKRASVYALNNNNMELFEELNANKAPFRIYADNLLLSKMRHIQILLMAMPPAPLERYSITSQNLQDMNAAINAYEAILSKPRDIIVERKMHNYTANQMIVLIREVLMKMDRLINIFSGSAFEHEYKSARIIIDLGTRHNPVVEKPA